MTLSRRKHCTNNSTRRDQEQLFRIEFQERKRGGANVRKRKTIPSRRECVVALILKIGRQKEKYRERV